MTLSEFKAWFEGFTEDMDTAPSEKQWDRIKTRVGEITGHAVSYPVFVDRHWPYNGPRWGLGQGASSTMVNGLVGDSAIYRHGLTQEFDSHTAMNALGRADAKAIQ